MKKIKMAVAMIVFGCTLSSCGRTEDLGNTQMDEEAGPIEISEENPQAVSDEAESDSYEEETHDYDVDAELELLLGEYDYLSDYGTGKLTIKKTTYGYDISDYESESSYRFLADSSNIETIEDNRIYMKYPEQVLSDGTVIFSWYILEYSTDGIDVYYGKSANETQFLYHAAKESAKSPQDEQTDDGDLLYEAFLKNEIGVINPYVEDMKLTVMDDKNYESEFEDAKKRYAYVDVNSDDNPELIFQISSDTSELMYILGIYDNELICFDVFETHTPNISFGVYDYGFVWQVQDYDGFEMTFYTYTADGQPVRARRFTEDNRADIAAHEGEEPQWIDWKATAEDN